MAIYPPSNSVTAANCLCPIYNETCMIPRTINSTAVINTSLVRWPVETRTETFQHVALNSTLKDSVGNVGIAGDFLTSYNTKLLWASKPPPQQTLLATYFYPYTNQPTNTPILLSGIPAGAIQMTVTLYGGGGMSGTIPNVVAGSDGYEVSIFGGGGSGAIQVYSGIPVSATSLIYYQFNTVLGAGMNMLFLIGSTTIGSANGGSNSSSNGGITGTILYGGSGGITTSTSVYTPNSYVGTTGQNGAVYLFPNETTSYLGPQPTPNSFQYQSGVSNPGSICTGGSYSNVVVTYNGPFAPPTLTYNTNLAKPAGIMVQVYGL